MNKPQYTVPIFKHPLHMSVIDKLVSILIKEFPQVSNWHFKTYMSPLTFDDVFVYIYSDVIWSPADERALINRAEELEIIHYLSY